MVRSTLKFSSGIPKAAKYRTTAANSSTPVSNNSCFAVALATKFRSSGVRVQLYAEQKKFKAKMSYADKIGAPFVVFLGEDEIRDGVVACKDMQSGEQTKMGFEETLARVRQLVKIFFNSAAVFSRPS